MPVMAPAGIEALQLEELVHQQGHLVGGARGDGGDAPVVQQLARCCRRARRRAPNRPMTVWVLPTSMATSTGSALQVEADVEHRCRVGHGADRDPVGARRRVAGDRLEGDPAGDLDGDTAGRRARRRRPTSAGSMLSTQDEVGARPPPPPSPGPGCRIPPRTARPGQRRLASATAASMEIPARWLSLTRMPSESEPRWLTPPPARTAAFSSARKPGRRLAGVANAGGRRRRRRRTAGSGWRPPKGGRAG